MSRRGRGGCKGRYSVDRGSYSPYNSVQKIKDKALSDGFQALTPPAFRQMMIELVLQRASPPGSSTMPDPDALTELQAACQRRRPGLALVLGSGMGGLVRDIRAVVSVPFADVPGLAASTVEGHRGTVTLGEWRGRPVVVFAGRIHHYEGHPYAAVVRPVRIAFDLGVRVILHTNAAGGIRGDLVPGSLMAVTDHIEWTRPYWWRHPGPGGLGPSRPSPYSRRLLTVLRDAARGSGPLHEGVYASVTGPSYETPAEIRALRVWGADAVGMSTAREVQEGRDLGMECAAVSLITNRAAGLTADPLTHEEVLRTAAAQADRLARLLEAFLLGAGEE